MSNKVLIVASYYYKDISNNLIKGATCILENLNINYNIEKTDGSFEIPFMINRNLKLYDGFIALGCIIRGETYHFELISNEVTRKIMDLSITSHKPIGFGIITCENMQQAIARSTLDQNVSNRLVGKSNKGNEAALAVANLIIK